MQLLAIILTRMDLLEHQDIQSTFSVMGQSVDFISVPATTTHTQENPVMMLECIAMWVSDKMQVFNFHCDNVLL